MYKTFDSPPAEDSQFSGIDKGKAALVEPKEQNWLCAAAYSTLETVKSHPLETSGTALLALAALRLKTPILEELAASAAGLGKTAAKSGSGVPLIRASKGLAGEMSAAAETTASEGSTFVSPWAREAVKDAGPLADQAATAVTSRFAKVMPKGLPADATFIPTITRGVSEVSGKPFVAESGLIVERFGQEGHLYHSMKDSTVRIHGLNGKGGGTGFFVDEKGFIATANHVVRRFKGGPINVELASGEVLPARLVARDASKDWAMLEVDGLTGIHRPFEFASAREIKPGRNAFLIGHPAGHAEKVMNRGQIEGFSRSFEKPGYLGVKHTIESIGGFSGAPIVLDNHRVAGIHTLGRYGLGHAEGTSIRHLRPALDALRARPVQGIDWETTVNLTENARRIPKTTVTGRLAPLT